ncbi:molecular chaperone [Enterobacter roggenkampii]|uniref:fimbrial biogenesis chaperone n=1 Tax=Enterobacter roggenkampii TaxID=1812935 RepID=UPI00223873E9|nr:molecular chaperone [Enterobacter roggenkampii]MCW5004356.1 molecular chaperone [Enterobacter roggenkampii]
MKKKIILAFVLVSFSALSKPYAVKGFGLNSTRVVVNEGDSSKSIVARNNSSEPMLVVSKIIDHKNNTDVGWVTPQVTKIESGEKLPLRLFLKSDAFSKNEESLFFLSSTAIQASSDNDLSVNKVPVAVGVKIKVFYRPKYLSGSPDDAAKNLVFEKKGKILTVKNDSQYHVILDHLVADDKPIYLDENNSTIPPRGRLNLKIKKDYTKIMWVYINDLGGRVIVENK